MAGNQLRIDGLAELRSALLKLPAALTAEAGAIVQGAATATASAVIAAYPAGPTGNLRRGVRVDVGSAERFATSAMVRSRAFHAWLYENGSGPRRWAKGKPTGRMPAGHVLIPIAMARRRAMLAALIELVERAGLDVTGTGHE